MSRIFSSRFLRWWLPLAAGLIFTSAAIIIWQALVAREQVQIARLTDAEATNIKDNLTGHVESQIQALKRMARQLEFWSMTLQPELAGAIQEQWSRDARLHVQQNPGYEGIAWFGASREIWRMVPKNLAELNLDGRFGDLPEVRRVMERSRQSQEAEISRPIHLPSGEAVILICAPLLPKDEYAGCVSGIFNVKTLFDSVLRDNLLRGYDITISDQSLNTPEHMYSVAEDSAAGYKLAREATVDLHGASWKVRVWPTQRLLKRERTILPEVTLTAGLLVALLLGFALFEFQKARAWARRIEHTRHSLERAEHRHLLTLETCLDAVITMDDQGIVREWNRQAELVFGWSKEDAIGGCLRDMIVPHEDREAHDRGLSYFLQTGQAPLLNRRLEVTALRRNGKCFPVELTITPLETAAGWQFTAFVRDITDRKRLEQRFRATVESAPTAMVMINPEGQIVLVNSETEKLFGYSRNELLGEQVEKLVPDRFRDNHPQMRAGFFRKPAARRMGAGRDLYGLRRDGTEFPVEIGLNPVETDEGLFVLSAVVDITERKRTEEQLRLLNETLEQRVVERTSELIATMVDLKNSKDAAEDASRAKSAFLANMSHEIRTPLNAVIGMTELVLDGSLSTQQREYLRMIQASGESLLSVINDILDFSKIEAGHLALEDVPFSHADLLGETLKPLGLRAANKGLELICRIAPEVPAVLSGDAGRLRQIVNNLVGNSVKFTEQGEVIIDVSLDSSQAESVVVHYAVHDTGIGIPEGKLERMFEAFEQADLSTTRRFGGTGLGLAISSRLVEMMEGSLWAESREGAGSTFHFTARFNFPPEQPPPTQPADMEAIRDLPVLVVDDNATNRMLLHDLTERWGMHPSEASGATEALQMLRLSCRNGNPHPLVLIDAHMPDIDGLELAHQIKHDPTLCGTIIMMLSSGDRPGDRSVYNDLDVAAHLLKPIQQSELLDAILQAIGVAKDDQRAAEAETYSADVAPRNVLLAEDSLVNQKLAVALLNKFGHHADIACNGREAVERWRKGNYDFILMDVQMPELDGLEATKLIRSLETERDKRTPIIAMTAHALKGDRERCLAAGMDEYVPKPIRRQQLLDAIRRVLDTEQGAIERQTVQEPEMDSARGTLVNWPLALETAFDNPELLKDLANAYLQESKELLSQMQSAIGEANADALMRAAHTLKGQLRIFGLAAAEHLAFHIENTARDGSVEVEEPLFALQNQLEQVEGEMHAFVHAKG